MVWLGGRWQCSAVGWKEGGVTDRRGEWAEPRKDFPAKFDFVSEILECIFSEILECIACLDICRGM